MYEAYWRFQMPPFDNTPDPAFLYESKSHTEAIGQLMYAVEEGKGAALLTGEIGSGKTLLSRLISQRLLNEGNYAVGLVTHPSLTAGQILKEIYYQLTGKEAAGEKQRVIHQLQTFLYDAHNSGESVVVILDEAQVIRGREVLDELRMLLNFQLNDKFLLTLLFMGQPELRDKIDRYAQLRQRLAVWYHLPNLDESEVAGYIQHRLAVAGAASSVFSAEAVTAIAGASSGCPREINTLCDLSLLKGFQRSLPEIDAQTVSEVARAQKGG